VAEGSETIDLQPLLPQALIQ